MMTDSIADMLTRIRNANRIERPVVDMPATGLKRDIARVLKEEGYIHDFQVGHIVDGQFQPDDDLTKPKAILRIRMKYGLDGERVIRHIQRCSTPGRRLYRRCAELQPVLDGLGIAILTTNRGVMSDRQARTQGLGGELLCVVW